MTESRTSRTTLVLSILLWLTGLACAASHHAAEPSELGTARASSEMTALIDRPGPIEFEMVKAADWVVPLSGLLNLDHPEAKAAGLEDRDEAIGVYFYALRHPRYGTFIVDTGIEAGFRNPEGNPRVGFLLESVMRTSELEIHTTTGEWQARQSEPLTGVFLTHVHLDHVMGVPDLDPDVVVYAGPGEPEASAFLNMFTSGTIDRMLEGAGSLREWPYTADPDGRFAGVVDIFGDGSVWAISVPGHTPGSTAYLVRSTEGPKLLVGDASHTSWGWIHGVEPGTFSADRPRSAKSLATLRELARTYPQIGVYLGHQQLAD
jgi:glyoxylase-like metal-dependent hydrolase (beta-lactamase superfamily II)